MENRSPIDTLTRVMSPPPPMPWTARAAMSIPMLFESAATRDPAKKTTLADIRIGFRPKISENLAQIGVELAAPSRYAEPIQVKPAAEPKCSEMVGKAVVMIVYALKVSSVDISAAV
jgi:hypothetical protein